MTVGAADVAMTWLLARLLTSACHVTQSTVMGADVAVHVAADVSFDPTRSTGQPDPVNGNRVMG